MNLKIHIQNLDSYKNPKSKLPDSYKNIIYKRYIISKDDKRQFKGVKTRGYKVWQNGIRKCVRLVNYKVWQQWTTKCVSCWITKCGKIDYIQSALGITK